MTKRRDNWFSALYKTIKEQAKLPHEYGEQDCLCQVSDGIKAMTGYDHIAEFRGQYTSYDEALALLAEKGFGSPEEYVIDCGFHPIDVIDANDGDIGAVDADGILAFGQFLGPLLYVQTERGKGRIPRSRAIKAYRVD